jgi:hypothetical protein
MPSEVAKKSRKMNQEDLSIPELQRKIAVEEGSQDRSQHRRNP